MLQKSRWTLPQIVHPTGYRRFVICVPNERFYIAAFEGLLIELTYSKNWQRDSAHTAAVVSRVWQEVLASAKCEQECTAIIEEMGYQMSVCEQLRFHNGKLQGLCCGEWTDITGQGTYPPDGGTQPGGGTEQPAPGACTTYHASMAASNKWKLPAVVNAGDVLTISNAKGAGNDGTISPWQCPDGSTFFANLCIGGTGGTSGGDPLNTAKHMRLIANVGGTFVDILAGPYTVPGGVSNAEVYLQTNDSALGDNAGSYTFDIEFCNNSTAAWSSILNFELNSYASIRTGGFGVWVPGVGIQGESNGFEPYVIQPWLDFSSCTVTGYEMFYNAGTVSGSGESVGCYAVATSSGYIVPLVVPTTGTGQLNTGFADKPGCTEVQPTLNSGMAGSQVTLRRLTLFGRGTKPPQLP